MLSFTSISYRVPSVLVSYDKFPPTSFPDALPSTKTLITEIFSE